MRKIVIKVIAFVLVFTAAFSVSACGNKDIEQETLKITIGNNDTEKQLFLTLADAFEEYMENEKGMTIKVDRKPSTVEFSGTNGYSQSIATLFAQEKLGDVIYTGDSYASAFIKDGQSAYFANLYDYLDDSFLNLYDDAVLNSGIFNINGTNKLAFMPRSYDQVTVYINKKIFKAIGMESEIPTTEKYGANWEDWTWDAFKTLLGKMRTAMNTIYGTSASYYYPVDANLSWNAVYGAIIESFGGYSIKIDGQTIKSGFDSANTEVGVYEKTNNALAFMKDLVVKEYTPAKVGVEFANGYMGMWFTTRPNVARCKNNDKVELAFAPLPKVTDEDTGLENTKTSVGFGAMGYALNVDSSKKDLALEFIKFCVGVEGQRILCAAGTAVPVLNSERTRDGVWTNIFPGVDQSAFLFDHADYQKYVASYARGVKPEYEFSVYSYAQAAFINNVLTANTTAELAASIYDAIDNYLVL